MFVILQTSLFIAIFFVIINILQSIFIIFFQQIF